ncbi:receptor-like protein 1 isoform X4 [Populus trichocarpa]|uniref:receptor-like protein 1 isoform X4 n=1 Tax=Populus trichocarpa TaxID=3694 RepID=UPI0022776450|nr:receptor-like protein 1 isoform X4 [Populus trichocarpa]
MMMKKMWVWMLLTLLTYGRCYGCLEEERIGLLEIKALINPNSIFGHLGDWTANKEDIANCCDWSMIECDSTTRRVIHLSLAGARDFRLGDWVLNASLFLPFKELQSLDLNKNRLVGCSENQGFEVLSSKLRKLNALDLSGNRFSNNFISCFNGLSSLRSLDLSSNLLKGSADFYGFKVLSSRLKKLESLRLKMNGYNDSIFSTLTGFSSLKSLDLSYNQLTGSAGFNAFQLQPMRLGKLENLYLSRNQLNSNISSILSGLLSLKSLDLSYNMLRGSSINGFDALPSKLRELESLDLSYNRFNDSDLSYLCEFPSLKSLNLSGNMFLGSTTINGLRKLEVLSLNELTISGSTLLQSLGALPSLKTLSLKETNLSGTSISQGSFFNSTTLEELILDGSSFPTNYLQNIGAFSALKILSFSGCDLNSTLPAKDWCELKNLEQLDISWNNLKGSLPDCFRNLTSLQLLDVSGNRFVGNIASGPLTNLKSLEFLSLSNNHFEVPLSFNSFMNHSKLKFFICDHNTLIGDKAGFQNFIPKFQLMFFSLSSRTSKALNADIPNFLYSQYDLRILDLSQNNFNGMFPSWLLKNNTRLEQLYLRENSFVGPLILQNQPNPYMNVIDISNNNIHGQIPRNMCLVLPNVSKLRMHMNGLIGSLPSCFGNMSSLEYMDLSDNQLSRVKLEQLKSSWFVKLSNNNLGEQLPPSIFNSSAFLYLYLDGNNFTGQISGFPPPNWIRLSALDISNNQLSGMLPTWMGNFSYLQAIDLSRNHFEGPIPRDFCDLGNLKYLDMSENYLFGSVPSCFSPSTIKHIHLSKNQLSGPLTNAFYNSSSLVTLDLNYNNFMGPISNWFGNLSVLSVLLLKANHFADRELGSFLQQLEWWNPSRTCCPQQSSSFQCGTQ